MMSDKKVRRGRQDYAKAQRKIFAYASTTLAGEVSNEVRRRGSFFVDWKTREDPLRHAAHAPPRPAGEGM